jgi:DNA repair protein RAD5
LISSDLLERLEPRTPTPTPTTSVGRLPTSDAKFLSPLLDASIIHLSGSIIDCPIPLTTGCDILLCIRVHLTKKAFEKMERQGKGKEFGVGERGFWGDQVESVDEMKMRLRKVALGELFGMWYFSI